MPVRIFVTLLFFLIGILSSASFAAPVTGPVNRIVSLAPNVTELLFAAGAGNKVVAVSAFSDYPAAATRLPVVANSAGINLEAIMALHPDIVVGWREGVSPVMVSAFKRVGIPVYLTDDQSIPQMAVTLKRLGQLAGTLPQAQKAASELMRQYRALIQAYSHKRTVTVFFEISQQPLLTLNRNNLASQLITDCGGENVYGNVLGNAPQIDLASLMAKQPEVIIVSQSSGMPDSQQFWEQYSQLLAVKHQQIYSINADWLDRPGPRALLGMRQLCENLDHARHEGL